MSQLSRGAALLLVAGLAVASCGGTASPTPAATAAASVSPAASAGAVVLPKPEKTSLKLGASGASGAASGVAILARQLNLYTKYGVSVEHVQLTGTQAMQALLAGQIDMVDTSAGPVLATVGTGSHAQFVFVPRANMTDTIYSQTNIKTAADLRGKTLAISSFGSNSYAGAIYGLKQLGLTDKDVTLTTVGNDTQRLAALRSGAVAASVQDSTLEKDLNAQGFNSLVRLAEIKPPLGQPGPGIVVPVEFQKQYPNTVLAVVAAQLEAMHTFRTMSPDAAAPILMKELTSIQAQELSRQIAVFQQEPWTPKDGMCRPEDIQFAKEIAVSANPTLASVDPLQACNNSFLLKLKDLGFQKKLAIPGY
jgi:NitT/TauT family transport system substrate-binding protein